MKDMTIYRGNKIITKEDINKWEYKRLNKVYKLLNKLDGMIISPEFKNQSATGDLSAMRKSILMAKINYGLDNLREGLKTRTNFANFFVKLLNTISKGKRKSSIIKIVTTNNNLKAEYVYNRLNEIMLTNTKTNIQLNHLVNPDHYVLLGQEGNVQEVIEVTGGSPMPTRFFVHYGEGEGLYSKKDDNYQKQIFGVCKLPDGTNIGGVRHQIKEDENGFTIQLEVEFPSGSPNYMIREHQVHLACEFGHWINYIIREKENIEGKELEK